MDKWQTASAADLGREIDAGRLDPRDLTERFLDAIATHPDTALIFARLTEKRARAEADAAYHRQQAGARKGILDGVPIGWKDNFDSAGVVTEAGSRLLAGRVPEKDAVTLANATEEGLVCLGKTHLTELAFSGLGLNPMTATPPNVHDRRRVPGGSSSGAAVSTAMGLAAAGIGSDTGGSVRIPAAWNDLVGLKTTSGALSGEGVVPLSTTFDTPGPLCRTVEDAGLLFAALKGEKATLPAAAMPRQVVLAETLMLDDMAPEVSMGFDRAVAQLEKAGVAIKRMAIPEFTESAEVLASHGGRILTDAWGDWGKTIEAQPDTMFHQIETRFRGGAAYTAEDHAHSGEVQARLQASITETMATNGVLIMPSSPILPPFVSKLLGDNDYYTRENLLGLRNTRQANLLGLCSLTLPTATPMVGLMIMAGAGQEDLLLAIGAAFEPVIAAQ